MMRLSFGSAPTSRSLQALSKNGVPCHAQSQCGILDAIRLTAPIGVLRASICAHRVRFISIVFGGLRGFTSQFMNIANATPGARPGTTPCSTFNACPLHRLGASRFGELTLMGKPNMDLGGPNFRDTLGSQSDPLSGGHFGDHTVPPNFEAIQSQTTSLVERHVGALVPTEARDPAATVTSLVSQTQAVPDTLHSLPPKLRSPCARCGCGSS